MSTKGRRCPRCGRRQGNRPEVGALFDPSEEWLDRGKLRRDADGDAAPHHQAEVNTAVGATASCVPSVDVADPARTHRASTNPTSAKKC
jgi:hypothetical protein